MKSFPKYGHNRKPRLYKVIGSHKMMTATAAMRDAFGLRQKEALMSSKVIIKDGKTCLEARGAKGGCLRDIQITDEKQLAPLDKVAATAQLLGNANGRMMPPKLSLEQAIRAKSKL